MSDDGDRIFERQWPALFAIAYRMLGSRADAEDVLQEAHLRFHQALSSDPPRSPAGWLTTVVARLSIDHLKSARARRETYVGPWLPEPLVSDDLEPSPDASDGLQLADSLSTAFLLVLERLSPRERAVFLLREVFDFDYAQIAEVVDKTPANCRQIARRARRRLDAGEPRFDADETQHRALLTRFVAAAQSGDVDAFAELLTEDAELWADGGGKDPGLSGVRAIRRPIVGRDTVSRVMGAVLARHGDAVSPRMATVNGQPGVLVFAGEHLHAVLTLAVADGRIRAVYLVSNPDKLVHVTARNTLSIIH